MDAALIPFAPGRTVGHYVDGATGCWIFAGHVSKKGYGKMWNEGRRSDIAHRVYYQRERGPIPEGLQLDHLCRNRACVNPAHLEPVTGKVNAGRGVRATRTHCQHGHPYAGSNLVVSRRKKKIQRECRECQRAWNRRSAAKRRARAKAEISGAVR